MEPININRLMDEFHEIVNTVPAEDAVTRLVRHAATAGNVAAIESFARLLVIESARRRHAEAKLAAR